MDNDGQMDVMLTAAEVARRLRVTRATVYNMARDGQLPAYRLRAHTLRFPEGAFERWLSERSTIAS